MTPDLAAWCSVVRQVAGHARMVRTACPVAEMDQAVARLRDHADALDIDLHDPTQRKAFAMGALVEAQCGKAPDLGHVVGLWAALEEWGPW